MAKVHQSSAEDSSVPHGWWSEADEYGRKHLVDCADQDYLPETLFVFVHGFISSPVVWEKSAYWFQRDHLCKNADAFAFFYPSWPWQQADIHDAAYKLRTVLTTTPYEKARHLFFITHSTGGLVVKEMLRSDYQTRGFNRHDPNSLLLRTRRIFNLGVVHEGASLPCTAGLWICRGANFLVRHLKHLHSLIQMLEGMIYPKDWKFVPIIGHNRLLKQLAWRNRWATQLEADCNDLFNDQQRAGLPTPDVLDIIGDADTVIKRLKELWRKQFGRERQEQPSQSRFTRARLIVPGVHTGILSRHDDFTLKHIANPLKDQQGNFQDVRLFTIADRTIVRTLELERLEEFPKLIEAKPDISELLHSEVEGARPFNQYVMHKKLLELARGETHKAPQRVVVVAGDAGVGKSVILRRTARHLAARFLAPGLEADGKPKPAILPIVLPLQQARLTEREVEQFCGKKAEHGKAAVSAEPWNVLGPWVCRMMNDLTSGFYTSSDKSKEFAAPPAAQD